MSIWNFSHKPDSDWGEDDSSGKAVQPDHYPNVARPGGGYPEGKGKESDTPCKTCNQNNLVDGRCPLCDWPNSVSEPIKNFPLDPFRDDKAGIRAGSWKFGGGRPPISIEQWNKNEKYTTQNLKLIDFIPVKGKSPADGPGMAHCDNCDEDVIIKHVRRPSCPNCQDQTKSVEEWNKDKRYETENLKLIKFVTAEGKSPAQSKGMAHCDNCDEDVEIAKVSNPKCPNCNRLERTVDEWNKKQIYNDRNLKLKEIIPVEGRQPANSKGIAHCDNCNKDVEIATVREPSCPNCKEQNLTKTQVLKIKTRLLRSLRTIVKENQKRKVDGVNSKPWNIQYWLEQAGLDYNNKYHRSVMRNVMNELAKQKQIHEDQLEGGWNPEWTYQTSGYKPNEPGYLYIFQYNSTIVIGITNNWERRQEEYEGGIHEKTNVRNKNYILDPTDFSDTDIQFYNQGLGNLLIPSNEELQSRGLEFLKENPDKFMIQIPRNLRWQTDDREKSLKSVPRYRQRGIRRDKRELINKEGRAIYSSGYKYVNIAENAHVFGPMDGYIAQNIENAIMQWWASLNITPTLDAQTYTETIQASADPSHATVNGMDIGSDLTLDLHLFLIQQMLENGGHLTQLNEVISPEDQQRLIEFFDNDPNKINAAFGMTWDSEQDKYVYGSNFGAALGISEPYIPASNWSFNEAQEPEEQIQDIETQRAMQLREDQQKALNAPQLSPKFYGDQKFQEELAKHPEWAETPLPSVQIPQDQTGLSNGDEGIYPNQPYMDPINKDIRMIDENNYQWVVYNNQWQRVAKTSDYQGSTNWETWNTKVMMDNDYGPYTQSREMVKNFVPVNEFAIWATQTVIAPHNKQALENAQEWNDIPYDERPTGREHMSEGAQALTEGFDEIFGMDPKADETASIIDESKVNWNEIYNSIVDEIKESEKYAHEDGEHNLLITDYMTEYSASELAELQAESYPWCPICNVDRPDEPGDLTIPSDWTQ